MTPASAPVSRQVRPATRVARAWAAQNASSPLAPSSIERREPLADDVVLDILYCGVCHSDLHQVRNEWNGSIYPVVPGHEIVGRVARVGSGVTKFREGDIAAVGCLVDSCQHCEPCAAGVKFARAFGAHVVLFTTSAGKAEDGLRLGAHEVVVSKDAAAMARHASSLDFVLDAASADHDINAYLQLLKLDGTLTLVGAPARPLPVAAFNLLLPRRSFAGSGIGGIRETQEMLDFCAEHGIVSDIELISIDQINSAYDRMLRSEVRYRFVIDMASLKA